jgi:hypothetical protein
MSPYGDVTTIEMSPNLEVSTGGQIGKDSHEQQGITTSGSLGASRKRRTETSPRRGDDGDELRQNKRLAKRYREGGVQGLRHRNAGRESNRRKSKKFRERVLRLVGKKCRGLRPA